MTPLGERLRAARVAKDLSLRDLGKAIDRAFETIGSVERGERKPSKELLRRLCAALDLDLAELLPLSGRLPPEMVDFLCSTPAARALVQELATLPTLGAGGLRLDKVELLDTLPHLHLKAAWTRMPSEVQP